MSDKKTDSVTQCLPSLHSLSTCSPDTHCLLPSNAHPHKIGVVSIPPKAKLEPKTPLTHVGWVDDKVGMAEREVLVVPYI